MCSSELEDELKRGQDAAKAIVQHMEDMGCASHCVFPVTHVYADGRMAEWKVTVELSAIITP